MADNDEEFAAAIAKLARHQSRLQGQVTALQAVQLTLASLLFAAAPEKREAFERAVLRATEFCAEKPQGDDAQHALRETTEAFLAALRVACTGTAPPRNR